MKMTTKWLVFVLVIISIGTITVAQSSLLTGTYWLGQEEAQKIKMEGFNPDAPRGDEWFKKYVEGEEGYDGRRVYLPGEEQPDLQPRIEDGSTDEGNWYDPYVNKVTISKGSTPSTPKVGGKDNDHVYDYDGSLVRLAEEEKNRILLGVPVVSYASKKIPVDNSVNTVVALKIVPGGLGGNIDLGKITFDVVTHGLDVSKLQKTDAFELLYNSAPLVKGTLINNRVSFVFKPIEITPNNGNFSVKAPTYKDNDPNTLGVFSIRVTPDTAWKSVSDYATAVANNNFVWSDMWAQGHSTATKDWMNGYKQTMPLLYETMSFGY